MENLDITDRIRLIMEHFGLTASSFADEVGMPRSGLSHVLNGRNSLSSDAACKIAARFPQVDLNWLMMGQGHFPSSRPDLPDGSSTSGTSRGQTDLFADISVPSEPAAYTAPENEIEIEPVSTSAETPAPEKTEAADPLSEPIRLKTDELNSAREVKKISQIIVFYNDGTFESFNR